MIKIYFINHWRSRHVLYYKLANLGVETWLCHVSTPKFPSFYGRLSPDGIHDIVLKSRDPQIRDTCLVCHAEFVETQRISSIDHANWVHHLYHYLCLRQWRTSRNGNSDTCPLERIAITSLQDLNEPLHKDATSPQNKVLQL